MKTYKGVTCFTTGKRAPGTQVRRMSGTQELVWLNMVKKRKISILLEINPWSPSL
jgi:hypothetical protein